ncbi:hypothetical protein ACIRPT_27235 [Streptomyces sp. NPDC101227]
MAPEPAEGGVLFGGGLLKLIGQLVVVAGEFIDATELGVNWAG